MNEAGFRRLGESDGRKIAAYRRSVKTSCDRDFAGSLKPSFCLSFLVCESHVC
jgi:hypothetical protein